LTSVHLERLPIAGVYRATPRRKAPRSYDWYRVDALGPALPADWRPEIGSMHTVHRAEVTGLYIETGHRLITCVTGRLALVVVDVRKGSATFSRWIPVDLEPVERPTVVIPPGTAWGYQGFSEVSVVVTLHADVPLGPQLDPTDEDLQITWPAPAAAGGISLENALARGDLPE